MKDIVCLLIGCTREQLEDREFKNTPLGEEWWYYKILEDGESEYVLYSYLENKDYSKYHPSTLIKLTPRKLLQTLGTEVGRNLIHPNLWVNALMAEYRPISNIIRSNSFNDKRLKHGYKNTKIWRTYFNIKQRCTNTNHPRFNDYGGRGINMCQEWLDSIDTFIKWAIESGYNDSLTIDRIDVNGDYSPSNCRCVSYSTQAINTTLRKDNKSGFKGVSKDKHNWRADIQINKKKKFLGYFNSPEEASEAYEMAYCEREKLYAIEESNNLQYPMWCITDVRFPNEAKAIKERGGIIIRVNRDFEQLKRDRGFYIPKDSLSPKHESETALDNYDGFNYVIDNDGSIEALKEKVKVILVREKLL